MKKRALISVFDKTGILDFAKELVKNFDYEIVSTGGTAKLLKENNIPVTEVSEITKYPEMLEGRVKTLHPVIHGGILARRDKEDHMSTISKMDIKPIDIVVINLYPFKEVTSKSSCTLEDAIENIDIGGPSMIRSSSKNYAAVNIVTDPNDLPLLLNELKNNNGTTMLGFREQLAVKAFSKTSEYDAAISSYLETKFIAPSQNGKVLESSLPNSLNLNLQLKSMLRYGENPHQKAALYTYSNSTNGLSNATQIQGKELSFNNYLDLEAAWNTVCEFGKETPACVIIKHNNPCGVAIAPTLSQAYAEAFEVDSVSAFGGIVAFNSLVDGETASHLSKIFLEAIIAPDFSKEALEIFKAKQNLRVLKINISNDDELKFDIKKIGNGLLVQDINSETLNLNNLKVVTKRKPTDNEMIDLVFAWKVCKHVKSNAIVIAKGGKSIGIGAGQTNRVGSVGIAINQASYNCKDSVLASDAFFPFKDSIEIATRAGITAIIQPGGSIKDEEVIEACNKANIAMIFTGLRHFKH